jgi:hypothetical protein
MVMMRPLGLQAAGSVGDQRLRAGGLAVVLQPAHTLRQRLCPLDTFLRVVACTHMYLTCMVHQCCQDSRTWPVLSTCVLTEMLSASSLARLLMPSQHHNSYFWPGGALCITTLTGRVLIVSDCAATPARPCTTDGEMKSWYGLGRVTTMMLLLWASQSVAGQLLVRCAAWQQTHNVMLCAWCIAGREGAC